MSPGTAAYHRLKEKCGSFRSADEVEPISRGREREHRELWSVSGRLRCHGPFDRAVSRRLIERRA